MGERIRRIAGLANDIWARVIREITQHSDPPHGHVRTDDVFYWDLDRLAKERTTYCIGMEHLASKRSFYLALAQATPYALTSTVVAFMWALVTNRDLAIYPFLVAGAIAAFFFHCRREIRWLNQLVATQRIDIDRINERFAVRESQARSGFRDYRDKMVNYYDGYYSVSFDKSLPRSNIVAISGWIPPAELQETKDMMVLHPTLFMSMQDLESTSKDFVNDVAKFRDRVGDVITQSGLRSSRPSADPDVWRNGMAQGLIVMIAGGMSSITDIDDAETTGKVGKSAAENLRDIFHEKCQGLLNDPELKRLAKSAEEARIKAKRGYVDIRRTIDMLYKGGT
jgi:hypothetical protein